ncbi:MAG TPA: copper amine oxidase N-terminal domain-containing protein [Verrucomicrobiae bacterium]|nr:copper amine oxidase N-terminal domain-containing protein [Verrucomicrobiae bacterium]
MLVLVLAWGGAGPIAIVINGNPLPLRPPPRLDGGILLVPVRRTIEALGLSFAIHGKTVETAVGSKNVSLLVGSATAQVDGGSIRMDAPLREIDGTLYAPLRFFTDVLGAQAHFDRKSNTVTIVAQLVGRTDLGVIAERNGIERFGTVAAVDVLSDPPTITLGYSTEVKTIPISPNATIEMQNVNANVTVPGELSDVRPGDFARIEMKKNGSVESVTDAYGSRSGRIVAIAGGEFVLDDGHVISFGRTTEVALNGKAATFADLLPGDEVSVRYNVESNEVREVLASRIVPLASASPGALRIDAVSTGVDHPLRPGEAVDVTLKGSPGASASFDIGSFVTGQAMHEQSPGVYVGSYTIPPGASFDQAPVIGHLSRGGELAEDASAPQTISASSSPPGIGDFAPAAGAWVNTNRPAVYATFAADAVAVDPSSASLWVNGRDVSSECVRSAQFIQYLPSYSYPDGPVHVTVRVSDRAGNTTTKSWTFDIRTH